MTLKKHPYLLSIGVSAVLAVLCTSGFDIFTCVVVGGQLPNQAFSECVRRVVSSPFRYSSWLGFPFLVIGLLCGFWAKQKSPRATVALFALGAIPVCVSYFLAFRGANEALSKRMSTSATLTIAFQPFESIVLLVPFFVVWVAYAGRTSVETPAAAQTMIFKKHPYLLFLGFSGVLAVVCTLGFQIATDVAVLGHGVGQAISGVIFVVRKGAGFVLWLAFPFLLVGLLCGAWAKRKSARAAVALFLFGEVPLGVLYFLSYWDADKARAAGKYTAFSLTLAFAPLAAMVLLVPFFIVWGVWRVRAVKA